MLLDLLRDNAQKFGVAVHAYVLMSNHFHLLATPQTADGAAFDDAGGGAQLCALFQQRPGPHRHAVGGALPLHADPDRALPARLHGLHRPEPGARRLVAQAADYPTNTTPAASALWPTSRARSAPRHRQQGLKILENLDHRGAVGADKLMGDGAGILIQMPDALYRAEMAKQGVTCRRRANTAWA
jgi:hypothetical protein